MTHSNHPAGWLLYDDSCGFCRRWVHFFESTLARRGFILASLQSELAQQKLNLPDDELLEDLRLLLASGDQVRGANAYRHLMRRIWWAYPLYLVSVVPLFRRVFDWAYRTFATNRYRISKACRIPASGASESCQRQRQS